MVVPRFRTRTLMIAVAGIAVAIVVVTRYPFVAFLVAGPVTFGTLAGLLRRDDAMYCFWGGLAGGVFQGTITLLIAMSIVSASVLGPGAAVLEGLYVAVQVVAGLLIGCVLMGGSTFVRSARGKGDDASEKEN